MGTEPEWAVNNRGDVMLVVSPFLASPPVRGAMVGRGSFVVESETGPPTRFSPDRKIAVALGRRSSVLLVEVDPAGTTRTTSVPTGATVTGPIPGGRAA